MKKLIIVSHCVLNTSSKVFYYGDKDNSKESINRKNFLKECLNKDIQLFQLPCPEFIMYGSKRWGHSREQFENTFFIDHSKNILKTVILQIKEYLRDDQTEVLAVVGINGSPSCGVDFSFSANWKGELSSNPDLDSMLKNYSYKEENGVFIRALKELLESEKIDIPIVALGENTLDELLGGKNEN
ncbi:MAG: hypothetical protein RR561_09025 [Peptostreptococcus sp.]|uniref:CD3072 family TudS-related putative desulfidase n=1 Tax=Peptostreptococcus sp. TaxID=1262 RepID=UPI002FC9F239